MTCVAAFSVTAHGAWLGHGGAGDWCILCWAFSFICTLLVLLVELFGLQARAPVSWTNFPITVACYACLLCRSAAVIFPLFFLKYQNVPARLATIVSLTKTRPGEVAGYMVCQTSVACIIFLLVSDPVTYDRHAALKWCMAVYCICFILSVTVVVLCVGECTGRLPVPFSKFLSAYGLLAAIMYLTPTILWPVFQFDRQYAGSGRAPSKTIAAAVLTALNLVEGRRASQRSVTIQ
uniref:MARVEL domain-containing protein n=1 Tax=Gasterosteus aculeatus aculeatus TaxID=481459 RepID=A0AAQ4QVV6_GASAC